MPSFLTSLPNGHLYRHFPARLTLITLGVLLATGGMLSVQPAYSASAAAKPTGKAAVKPAGNAKKPATEKAKEAKDASGQQKADVKAGKDKKDSKDKALLQTGLDEATQQVIREEAAKLDPQTVHEFNQLAQGLQLQSRTVNNELRDEEEISTADIGMLWEAAVERSGTIRYAIEKLSKRDATGKPVANDSFSKRMLQNLVHLGGVAGSMWTGSPAGVLGSGMIEDLMSGSPQDSALSRVTDADMVILAKEVETLQNQLIQQYYGYRHAQERLALAQEARMTIERAHDAEFGGNVATSTDGNATDNHATDKNHEALVPLMQSILDSAFQQEQNAQQAVSSSRTALALLVGPEAVVALDQGSRKDRESRKSNEKSGDPDGKNAVDKAINTPAEAQNPSK